MEPKVYEKDDAYQSATGFAEANPPLSPQEISGPGVPAVEVSGLQAFEISTAQTFEMCSASDSNHLRSELLN